VPESRPFVVAVGGVPGAGKTTLARRLADALHVPALARDEIKEGMHVTVGPDDPSDVHRFSEASFETFWSAAHDLLGAGVSLVVEAAFHRDLAAPDFVATGEQADLVLVWCAVDPSIALARYRARAPLRHPAHADGINAERMAHPTFDASVYDPPAGPWPVITVDTSGPEPIPDVFELCRTLRDVRTPA
jgi:predicted kinase